MSADLANRLRSLTLDYHDGRLNLAAYRSMRAALLDSLVASVAGATYAAAAAAVAVTQPRTGSWQQSDAITRPGKPRVAPTMFTGSPTSVASLADASTSKPSEAERGAPRSLPVRAIAIAVVVLAIAGFGIWSWHGQGSSGTERSGNAPTAAEQDRVRELLTRFTERGDWSDGHLASLNTDLLELGGARLIEAAAEPGFMHFVEELRRRLKEQQALSSTPLSADNSPLAALAVTVGLDLNAPDAAIHVAALPPPPPLESAANASSSGMKAGTSANGVKAASASRGAKGEASSSNATSAMPTSVSAGASDGTATPGSAGVDAGAGAGARSVASANGNASGAATSAAIAVARAGTNASTNAGTNAGASTGAGVAATTSAAVAAHEGACHAELLGSRRPFCHDLLPTGAEGPPLALIPAGAFEMGSSAAPEEQPVHRVTIRASFAISVYEVSQGEFKQFCEHSGHACPSQPWVGDDYPVVNVSWDDARAYTNWLSTVTHQRYTLPSEAQWEYAARAGRTGLFPSGDVLSPTDAHFSMLAKQSAAARRSQKFNANAFRLMHTVGNVREWVEDGWSPSFAGAPADGSVANVSQSTQRVARGGSYADGVSRLRLSMREGLPAGARDATTGFRIVRELP